MIPRLPRMNQRAELAVPSWSQGDEKGHGRCCHALSRCFVSCTRTLGASWDDRGPGDRSGALDGRIRQERLARV